MTDAAQPMPPGWVHKRLGDVLSLHNGYAFKQTDWANTGRPIIRIQNLKSKEGHYNHYKGDLPDRFRAKTGDLLFAWSGTPGTSFGAHVWDGPEAWINQHIFRVDFSSQEFDRDFLKMAINHNLGDYIADAQGGVGLAHITKAKLNESLLMVPPVSVQRWIARLIADYESKRADTASHLAHAKRATERFHQAVLAAGCSGRLTVDWRDANSGAPAAGIVATSLDQRARVAKLARKPPEAPDLNALDELPETWVAATVDQLCPVVTDGEHQTPPRTEDGVPLLSARNVLNGHIVFTPIDYVSEETYRQISRRIELRANDVLLTCSGSVGRSAVVRDGMRFALVRSVAVLRPVAMNSDFMSLALRSPRLQAQIDAKKTETAQANIFQGRIRALTIPLPPIEEQTEIVRRVDELLSFGRQVGHRIFAAERKLERSSAAMLAKAFRGELLPVETAVPAGEVSTGGAH